MTKRFIKGSGINDVDNEKDDLWIEFTTFFNINGHLITMHYAHTLDENIMKSFFAPVENEIIN